MTKKINANTLKFIAVVAMTLDHIAVVFVDEASAYGCLRFVGRLTAPIMCFFIAQGLLHTSNIRKYLLRIGVFALIAHTPYCICFGIGLFEASSVLATFFLGMAVSLVLGRLRANKQGYLSVFVCFIAFLLSTRLDWGFTAVVWISIFYLFDGNLKKQMLLFSLAGLILYIIPNNLDFGQLWTLGIFSAIPLLCAYNGERGTKNFLTKWGFYAYYPAHLLVLAAIDRLV